MATGGGMGLGAAGFGVLAIRTGYPAAFALTAALMSAVLLPAVLLPAVLAAAGRGRGKRVRGAGARTTDRSG